MRPKVTRNAVEKYWEARFDPPLKPRHSPCEVRVRVYDEAGMDTFYREEEGQRGMYAVATDDWTPFHLDMLDDEERVLYDAILGRTRSNPSGASIL
jgi:hypothetical protein